MVFQLKEKIKEFTNFSLAVNESTDAVDTAQLAVFIRGINSNFEITEELLKCIPLTGTTTANDIYYAIEHLTGIYLAAQLRMALQPWLANIRVL